MTTNVSSFTRVRLKNLSPRREQRRTLASSNAPDVTSLLSLLLLIRWQRSSRRRRPQWRTTSDNHSLCWTCRSTPSRTPVSTARSPSLLLSPSLLVHLLPPSVSAPFYYFKSPFLFCARSTLYFYPAVCRLTEQTHMQIYIHTHHTDAHTLWGITATCVLLLSPQNRSKRINEDST